MKQFFKDSNFKTDSKLIENLTYWIQNKKYSIKNSLVLNDFTCEFWQTSNDKLILTLQILPNK